LEPIGALITLSLVNTFQLAISDKTVFDSSDDEDSLPEDPSSDARVTS
jgi:hypothetical protein